MKTVLIPTKLDGVAKELLEDNGFTVVQETADSEDHLDALIAANSSCVAMIVRSERITAARIDAMPNLKLVVRAGAGYNTIDCKHARRRGVDVMNTPGANANAVAEEVIALALAAYRKIIPGDLSTRAGRWEKKSLMGQELSGKSLGIVGLGNIGQLVAKRLSGFEMRVRAFDPMISASRATELGVELSTVKEIFATSDVVTLHVPETEETRGMVNAELLNSMRDGAMLINCARSGIINEDDLRATKAAKGLIFCNDVYAKDAPGDKSVADLADIMLPHVGASTQEANFNAARRAAEQTVDHFDKGITRFVVNRAVPEGLDQNYQLLAYYLAKVARNFIGCDRQPQRIEASFYGDLAQYAPFLEAPIVLGLSAEFDPTFDHQDASAYLAEMGIEFETRQVDQSKGYGEAITIDLIEGSGTRTERVSVRGTIAEGNPMVSRINDFDKLYFDPRGKSLLAVYEDCPGKLAAISAVVAKHKINIEDIRCPQDSHGRAIAVLKVDQPVPADALAEIRSQANAENTIFLDLK
jgi:D-3-phosphoglycerate dehydrogenase